MTRRVRVWDGEEPRARRWHLVVQREVGSPETIKYSLSNAPDDTPLLRLAQMQGQRYWVERAFEDGKGDCGLADYQALSWRSWHHHVTMAILAKLYVGLILQVCHYLPGRSKWIKIEHRMFCHITQTWRGKPLVSRLAVFDLIAATTTKTGLTVSCELD